MKTTFKNRILRDKLKIAKNTFYLQIKDKNYLVNMGRVAHKIKRNTSTYKIWQKEALQRDGYKCRTCGSIDKLQVHHTKNFKDYPINKLDLNNAVTLCFNCHKKIHPWLKDNFYYRPSIILESTIPDGYPAQKPIEACALSR